MKNETFRKAARIMRQAAFTSAIIAVTIGALLWVLANAFIITYTTAVWMGFLATLTNVWWTRRRVHQRWRGLGVLRNDPH